MLRKFFLSLTVIPAIISLCGCESLRNFSVQDFASGTWKSKTPVAMAQTAAPDQLAQPSSIVVCRSHQCAPSKISMSREYIFNSLLQLFDNNNYQRVEICQADPLSHICIENHISLPAYVGVVPTKAYIDHVKITDVVVGKKGSSLNLILNYNVTYGGQVAECTPSQSLLFARNVNHVLLEDTGYNCKMTTIGITNIKTLFAIDYIDLDYGYIGGNYSIGMSGPAYGGSSNYMLLRMPRNAYPLSPALKAPKNKYVENFATGEIGNTAKTIEHTANFAGGVKVFPLEKKSTTTSQPENTENKTEE